MARYVVVEFDDNAQADEFVRRVNSNPDRKFRVPWVFAKPTKYCECPSTGTRSSDPIRVVRGDKWGWWVCSKCHRAMGGSYQSPHNLLDYDQKDAPAHLRRFPGWMFMTRSTDRSWLPGREKG